MAAKRKRKKIKNMSFDITTHVLVPKHSLLNDKEKKALFEKYNITIQQLPKISIIDAAIQPLKPKLGDVVKIVRESHTATRSVYYRGVINE